jgi:lipopolysaccharide transport system ATP-binding protein
MSMSDTVISVENLSKRYLIGHQCAQRERHTLRDIIEREARNFVRKAADVIRGKQIIQGDEIEELWALRHVSFEVRQGEVVGIIGRNGAGKSTLLKILSRITEPTEGRVRLRGRVGSLLEVGTGFHPELTGRENIFLNGAILGMNRQEIMSKFEEIVSFAEVERFLDTPVKRYSSGMYVRLAFAVAAHLEPEVLIVDEVLAVGDAEFQKKCLGKIDDVARREGRTVIFVSHNMAAIKNLCSQGIYLDKGQVQLIGNTGIIVAKYLSHLSTEKDGQRAILRSVDDEQRKTVFFKSVSILNHEGSVAANLDVTRSFHICIQCAAEPKVCGVHLVLSVETFDGIVVFSSSHKLEDVEGGVCGQRLHDTYYIEIPGMFLMPGSYFLTLAAHTPMVEVHEIHQRVLGFNIVDTGTTFAQHSNYRDIGIVIADLPWRAKLNV